MSAVFIHSPEIERYRYPPDCPFKTERAGMLRRILHSTGLLYGPDRREVPPRPATRQELQLFHTPRYLDVLERAERGDLDAEGLFMGLGTEDCPVFSGMVAYATLACGATLVGAELVREGRARVAFNPSGGFHHARPEKAAGFCYINDVAIACDTLARAGLRVFCLDVDAHHGDGVQDAFYRRPEVFTLSMHESGRTLFPGTGFEEEIGEGPGRGFNVNVPLPEGTHDEAFLRAFRAVVLPLLEAFDPDVVILEVGMDGLSADPLAHLALTNNAYAEVAHAVRRFGKPVLALGGGGYHPENTARGWALVWSVLCGEPETSHALGGVMLESTDWLGGLRDRRQPPDPERAPLVNAQIDATVEKIKNLVFPLHGL